MIGKLIDVLWALFMIKAITLAWFVEMPFLKYGPHWVNHADENPVLAMTKESMSMEVRVDPPAVQ